MAKPAPGQVQRRITLRLYPAPAQEAVLLDRLKLHTELYNAAIEERREAWRMQRRSVRYYDQQNQLPDLKLIRADLVPLGSHALQETLRRVDRAFAAFFRRVQAGETPGFPRFKSWRRFPGWTWPDPAGWRYQPGAGGKHGRLFVGHLGAIPARGKARTLGTPVSCTISYRQGRWYASAAEAGSWVVEVPTRQVKPSQTCPRCWFQAKKELSERVHVCGRCGFTADRDVAAAQVMLAWALSPPVGNRPGAESPLGVAKKRETPSRPLAVAGG